MAGTVHGLVNKKWARESSPNDANARPPFKAVAAFFDHLCTPAGGNYMTRIASVGGGGDLQAIGSTEAMGVWRFNTSAARPGGGTALGAVYFMVVYTGNQDINLAFDVTGAPGTPPSLRANSYTYAESVVSFAVAFREDGGNPWNGTTNNDGADTFGADGVWTDGGVTTLHCFPRSNSSGGSHSTNKNNTMNVGNSTDGYQYSDITYGFFHAFADEDNIAIFMTGQYGMQTTDEPRNWIYFLFGLGETQPNTPADPYLCYCAMDSGGSLDLYSEYGDSNGDNYNNGGIKQPGTTVGTLYFDYMLTSLDTTRQPNPYSTGGVIKYDESPFLLMCGEAWVGWGHAPGEDDFFRLTYGIHNEGYDSTTQRAGFGYNGTNATRVTVPWPNSIGEAPGGSRSFDGVYF